MIQRSLAELATMSNARLVNVPEGLENTIQISGVSTDSRTVQPGNVYIPLAGARADGHDFIKAAEQSGAAASFWKEDHTPYPQDLQIPLLIVKDPLEAMQQLAKEYLKQLNVCTIGITGSNGKTSTKDMVGSIFSRERKTQITQGNHNNEIGLPLTILDFDEDIQTAVLEMGMENYGEIAFLCQIAPLDLALIVSIGSAHMENFGSRDGIAKAKMEIASGLKPGGTLIWNAESPELARQVQALPESVKTISFGKDGDICRTTGVSYTGNGISFDVNVLEENPLYVNAIGDYQASNALAALAAAKLAGISEASIHEGLKNLKLTRMRSALISAGKDKNSRILDDTYKSNPESAASALETLMKIPAKKHIAVLADMLDLGEQTNELHSDIGHKARELGVDTVYTYGDLSKHTADAAGDIAKSFDDKEEILQNLIPVLDEDAVILVKGSRAMKMDEIVSRLLEEAGK